MSSSHCFEAGNTQSGRKKMACHMILCTNQDSATFECLKSGSLADAAGVLALMKQIRLVFDCYMLLMDFCLGKYSCPGIVAFFYP